MVGTCVQLERDEGEGNVQSLAKKLVLSRLRKPPLRQLPQNPTLIASTLLGSGVFENHACNYDPVLLHWPPSRPSHMQGGSHPLRSRHPTLVSSPVQ